jgi:hypothetical protein
MSGNLGESKGNGGRGRARLVRLGLGAVAACSGALAFFAVGGVETAGAYVAPGTCTAGFVDMNPGTPQAQIVAIPTSGCSATGQYRFSIWSTTSDIYSPSAPQHMLASTTSAPWVLPFGPTESPTCYYQVDFGVLDPHMGTNGEWSQYRPLASFMGVIPGCKCSK